MINITIDLLKKNIDLMFNLINYLYKSKII